MLYVGCFIGGMMFGIIVLAVVVVTKIAKLRQNKEP